MIPIASQTLSTSASSVTFSNIPQGYTDIIVIVSGTLTTAYDTSISMRFNDDSANNYSATYLYGTGSAAASGRNTNKPDIQALGRLGSSTVGNAIVQIQNYSNATTNKTVLGRGGVTSAEVFSTTGLWRNTSAITKIVMAPEGFSGSFASGTTFSLYGIQAGTPKAQGGQLVTTDGTYWYHTFIATGTFTPNQSLSNVDFLVLAGGGGAGEYSPEQAGGGGAGGLRSSVSPTGGGGSAESKLSFSADVTYTMTVGAGGSRGSNGGDSSISGSGFSTLTSVGGGRGSMRGAAAGSGGSGGGGGDYSGTGGSGTANQGYGGGNGTADPAGSGGGAGGAGQTGSFTRGIGVSNSISGTAVTYGTGGSGGGSATNGSASTANVGKGGDSGETTAYAGGSGVIIIRYAV